MIILLFPIIGSAKPVTIDVKQENAKYWPDYQYLLLNIKGEKYVPLYIVVGSSPLDHGADPNDPAIIEYMKLYNAIYYHTDLAKFLCDNTKTYKLTPDNNIDLGSGVKIWIRYFQDNKPCIAVSNPQESKDGLLKAGADVEYNLGINHDRFNWYYATYVKFHVKKVHYDTKSYDNSYVILEGMWACAAQDPEVVGIGDQINGYTLLKTDGYVTRLIPPFPPDNVRILTSVTIDIPNEKKIK